MISRRRILTMFGITAAGPAVVSVTEIVRQYRTPKPDPEPEYLIVQTVNAGTEDEHTTVHRIKPTQEP